MRALVLAVVVAGCKAPPAVVPAPARLVTLGDPVRLGAVIPSRRVQQAALAVTPDGRRAVTADRQPNLELDLPTERGEPGVVVWDAGSWEPITHLGEHWTNAVAISADGAVVATAEDDGQVRVWDVATRQVRNTARMRDAIAIWTDGARVIAAAKNGEFSEWRFDASNTTRGRSPSEPIAVAVIAPAGDRVALAGQAHVELASFDGASLTLATEAPASTLAFTPDGAHLAIGDRAGRVTVWNAASGAREAERVEDAGWAIRAIAIAAPDRMLVAKPTQGQYLIARPSGAIVSGMEGPFDHLASFDGGRAAVGTSAEGALRVFDVEHGAARATDAHTGRIALAAFGAHGIVSDGPWPDSTGGARRWDRPTSQPLAAKLDGDLLAVSPAGTLGVIYQPEDSTLHLLDLVGGEPERTIDLPEAIIAHAAFSADDRYLALGGGREALRLELATASFRRWQTGEEVVQAIAISRDGALVATGGDKLVVWDAATGTARRALAPEVLNVSCLRFTPDAASLVTATESLGVQRWSLATGSATTFYAGEKGTPQGSGDEAYAADLSDDGRLLATGHGSGLVRLWSLADGVELARSDRDHAIITTLDLAPDGSHLVTGDGHGQLLVWPLAR